MTSSNSTITTIASWVTTAGQARDARRAAARWRAQHPVLECVVSPARLVADCQAAPPAEIAPIVKALVGFAPGDSWAQTTALALLAPQLRAVVGRWARAGISGHDLDAMEAELVAETWEQLAAGPPTPDGDRSAVNAAWARVRTTRRRERRHQARTETLTGAEAATGSCRPAAVEAAGLIVDAVRDGRLTVGSARAVYATRVLGFTTAETAAVLGCRVTALRVRRARAEQALAA